MSQHARAGWKQFRISPEFYPKAYTVLRKGYTLRTFGSDFQAALSVAIVSLPLAMALAIASGCSPERGLYTSVVAGFLVALLGGSRHQITGPTAAFVVVVCNIVNKFGYDGLVVATLMAGLMLLAAGFLRFGTIIQYLPFPITTGFTTGIGCTLLVTQLKDLLGLQVAQVPADFLEKVQCLYAHLPTANGYALALSAMTIALIYGMKQWKPKVPGFLVAFIFSTLVTVWLDLDIATIGSRCGDIPRSLPLPSLPVFSWEMITKLFPSAFSIAFLAGIESLLSCVIADSMAGTKHRSNCELVALGVGNVASVLFGGIPATGALARTATNIRAGGQTPVVGMLHAVLIALMMLFFAPYAKWVPLSCLASVLIIVASNMINAENIRYMMRATQSDRAIFFVTFALTLFVDITVAIEVGAVLSMLFFTSRMIQVSEKQIAQPVEHDHADVAPYEHGLHALPNEIEMIYIAGPFFFGVAWKVQNVLRNLSAAPKVVILDMQHVPFIDASGVCVLRDFVNQARAQGMQIILTAVNKKVKATLLKMSGDDPHVYGEVIDNHDKAIERAYALRDTLPHGV